MYRQMSFSGTILALTFLIKSVTLQSVPVFLWSNQLNTPNTEFHFSTLVDQIELNDLLSQYKKNKIPVVAFVQKDLSVEQFASNDAPFISSVFDNHELNPIFLANVKNPRQFYSSFKNEEPIVTNEDNVIFLPGKTLNENDDFIKSYAEKLNSSGQVVFMLTGENNEFLKAKKRSVRETPEVKARATPVFATFPNGTEPCGLFSSSGATIVMVNKDNMEERIPLAPPQIDNSQCKCSDVPNRAETLALDFYKDASTTKFVSIIWHFANSSETEWKVRSIDIEFTEDKYPSVSSKKSSLVSVQNKFSFSCQKTVIPLEFNGTIVKDYSSITIIIEAFQMQPFYNIENKNAFEDSEDCAVWFTIPIWVGLIVILILITILYFGVIALISISTPDRFENPKGRGLIITNIDE